MSPAEAAALACYITGGALAVMVVGYVLAIFGLILYENLIRPLFTGQIFREFRGMQQDLRDWRENGLPSSRPPVRRRP